ncbi:LOW QUALITY PROTEIN: putative N-acetyltransferase 16 [Callospermophilus lateralis]
MKLEANWAIGTLEVLNPEKDSASDVKMISKVQPQEMQANSRSGLGLEAETKPPRADPGHEAQAKFLRTRLESVNLIDAGEGLRLAPWESSKSVARLLQRFCSLVKLQQRRVKVARLTRNYQLGPRSEGIPLITKQGILLLWFNALALLVGLGARLAVQQASGTLSPLPEAVSEAGGEVARLLLSPSVQRDVLQEGLDPQPYHPKRSNLRLLAAKGLEWRVDSLARPCPCVLTLCTSPFPTPQGGEPLPYPARWRPPVALPQHLLFGNHIAQVQSQLLGHLQPCLTGLYVLCQLFLTPQLWSQLAYFCQLGRGLVQSYMEQYQLEADT